MTRQPPRWFEQQARYLKHQEAEGLPTVPGKRPAHIRQSEAQIGEQWLAKQRPQAPVGKTMFRRLESLEEELSGSMSYTGNARWMIPYADMLTLLLGLFLVMLALFHADNQKLTEAKTAMAQTLQTKAQQLASQTKELEALKSDIEKMTILSPKNDAPEPDEELFGALAIELDDARHADKTVVMTPNTPAIEVSRSERGLVIRMMDRVLFSPGSAELSAQAKVTLNQLAEILKKMDRPMSVEGHTDTTPIATSQYPSNWELSTARATNIVRYFVEAHGFDPGQLSASGYGQYRPIAENSTIQGKQKNRRVDIVVLGKSAENALTSQKIPTVVQSDGRLAPVVHHSVREKKRSELEQSFENPPTASRGRV